MKRKKDNKIKTIKIETSTAIKLAISLFYEDHSDLVIDEMPLANFLQRGGVDLNNADLIVILDEYIVITNGINTGDFGAYAFDRLGKFKWVFSNPYDSPIHTIESQSTGQIKITLQSGLVLLLDGEGRLLRKLEDR